MTFCVNIRAKAFKISENQSKCLIVTNNTVNEDSRECENLKPIKHSKYQTFCNYSVLIFREF